MAETTSPSNKGSMIGAGLAAIGASVCCIGPLVLLSLGIGGAWISTLSALTPYRWIFITITLGFLGWAFYKLYIVPRQCAPEEACAVPSVQRNQRIIFWVVTVFLVALIAFPWYGTMFFE